MSSAQALFLERVNQEKEVRVLKTKLSEKTEEIEAQKIRIAQLEAHPNYTLSSPFVQRKLTEEQTQCSFDQEPQQEQFFRLSEVLRARESEAINLHLAIEKKEKEAETISRRLLDKEEEVRDLRLLNMTIEKQLLASIERCDELKREWKLQMDKWLQEENGRLEQRQRKEEIGKVLQDEIANLRDQETKLKEENRAVKVELQQLRQLLNAKDWKLFCIQTELDLRVKQCHNLKATSEEQSQQIEELQSLLKQKQIILFSQQQENVFLEQQNQSFSTELKRKQQKIEQIVEENKMKQQQQFEEFARQLRERENQLIACLNQKKKELDEVRLQVVTSSTERQRLTQENQRLKEQNYELQQSITDHEDIMGKQSDRIAMLQEHIEAMNKRLNELALLDIIKKEELSQQKAEIEAQILRHTQKINRLTVELIQRDVAANKTAYRLAQMERAVESSNKQYLSVAARLERAQAEAGVRQNESKVRQAELISSLANLQKLQEVAAKREMMILELKERISSLESETLRLNHAITNKTVQISQLKGQVEFLRGSVNSFAEKLAMKNEDYERICQKSKDLSREVGELQLIKEKMESNLKIKELALSRVKEQQNKLIHLSQQYIDKVGDLHREVVAADQTTQFQILTQDLLEEKEEKHIIQHIAQQFCSNMKALIEELE